MSISILNQYVVAGFLTPVVAKSLSKYGPDKLEDAVQAAVEAGLRRLDPLAAARRAVEPEFSLSKLNEINYFWQISSAEGEQDQDEANILAERLLLGEMNSERLASTLGVTRRRAQQIIRRRREQILAPGGQAEFFFSGAAEI